MGWWLRDVGSLPRQSWILIKLATVLGMGLMLSLIGDL